MHEDRTSHRFSPGTALAFGLLSLTALVATADAYPLQEASLEGTGNEAVFSILSDGAEILHNVFVLEDPPRVVVDLFGADQAVSPVGYSFRSDGFVQSVRASLWKDSPEGRIVRYVMDVNGPVDYSTSSGPGILRVTLCSAASIDESGQATSLGAHQGQQDVDPPALFKQDPQSNMIDASASNKEAASAFFGDQNVFESNQSGRLQEYPYAFADQDPAPQLGDVDPGAVQSPIHLNSEPISLDVQSAELRSVLRTISEFGGLNIVPDREIAGPITVRIDRIPWRQALDIVCKAAGLVAIEGDGYIRVATLRTWHDEQIDAESAARRREDLQPLVSRIFPVRYASAEELRNSVAFALSKRGSAEFDGRTNSILVHDIEPRLSEIQGLIGRLDTETKQVEIVARLVDVDKGVARQLGIDWSINNLHSTSERVSGSVGMSEALAGTSLTTRLGVVRDFGTLDATIEALERSNEATLISNPKITTVNNRKARILVGKEVPLIVLDEAGNPTTELKRVGIALEVTPYINSDNRITMDLHPEVSDLSAQATVQGGLIFTTTIADTRVMVNDGETAVIGGLIRSSETQFERGIPLLRSIPLLGMLFRQSDTRTESRELLIFVSPRVVDPGVAQAAN